jgi:endonuclease-8
MLDQRTTFDVFKNMFEIKVKKYPEMKIGMLLIDQSFVCGIGNYLRADILYYSKISPYRQLKTITKNEVRKLYDSAYNLIRYYASIQITKKLQTKKIKENIRYNLKYTPKDFGRVFMIYGEKNDINKNDVSKDKFYGRSIYWVKKIQL